MEIGGSRSSYEMNAQQIIQAVSETIFAKSTKNKFDLDEFKKIVQKLRDMLIKYLCPNDEPSVALQIKFLQEVHKQWDLLENNSIKVIHYMYEDDLLEGQIITHWFDKEEANLNPKFKLNLKKLIDFLGESSDEEESD